MYLLLDKIWLKVLLALSVDDKFSFDQRSISPATPTVFELIFSMQLQTEVEIYSHWSCCIVGSFFQWTETFLGRFETHRLCLCVRKVPSHRLLVRIFLFSCVYSLISFTYNCAVRLGEHWFGSKYVSVFGVESRWIYLEASKSPITFYF